MISNRTKWMANKPAFMHEISSNEMAGNHVPFNSFMCRQQQQKTAYKTALNKIRIYLDL